MAGHRLTRQRCRQSRQHLQPGPQIIAAVRAGDPVADDKRGRHPLAHKLARGDPADQRAAGIDHPEMADVMAAHPAKRDMHEIIRPDGDHRRGHDGGQRQLAHPRGITDRLADLIDNVALRDNAGDGLRAVPDKDTVGRSVMHRRRCRAKRRIRRQQHRRVKHQVGDAVLIGIGVDPLQRGVVLRGGMRRRHIHPAGRDIRLPQIVKLRHLAPGVAKGDNPLPGQRRQHLLIDGQRDGGIAERRMAVGHRHLIMRRQ